MAQNQRIPKTGGSTLDGMIARFEMLSAMSDKERDAYMAEAAARALETEMSDEDYMLMMAADGYFQDKSGEIEDSLAFLENLDVSDLADDLEDELED